MSVKFEVKMTEKYMYDFLLYHNYTHFSGLITAIAGVLCLGVSVNNITSGNAQSGLLCLMCAILFLVINPMSMKSRAKMQVQATFQKPLEYELTEDGIIVRQDEQEAMKPWSEVTKAVSTNQSVILYSGRMRAFIFPKECMGEQYEDVVKKVHTHMPPAKVKIRHIH